MPAPIFPGTRLRSCMGAQYLTMLTDAGMSIDEVAPRIKFNMGISSNYFMEIAKFRAARMLWAEIVKQYEAFMLLRR